MIESNHFWDFETKLLNSEWPTLPHFVRTTTIKSNLALMHHVTLDSILARRRKFSKSEEPTTPLSSVPDIWWAQHNLDMLQNSPYHFQRLPPVSFWLKNLWRKWRIRRWLAPEVVAPQSGCIQIASTISVKLIDLMLHCKFGPNPIYCLSEVGFEDFFSSSLLRRLDQNGGHKLTRFHYPDPSYYSNRTGNFGEWDVCVSIAITKSRSLSPVTGANCEAEHHSPSSHARKNSSVNFTVFGSVVSDKSWRWQILINMTKNSEDDKFGD